MKDQTWNGRRLPRYVVEDVSRHGQVRLYFRRRGSPKVRLPDLPFSPTFMAAYSRALSGKVSAAPSSATPVKPGSVRAVVVGYFSSAEFKQLDTRTQRVRRNVLDTFCLAPAGDRVVGELPFRQMEPRHIRKWRDDRADRPEAANCLVKFLRQVCAHAVNIDLCDRNAAREVPYIKTGSQGFHSWTLEEVSQFEAAHPIGTTARLALGLLLLTSQRRSDVVELGPQHVRAGWLKFVQVKNRHKKPVVIEIPVIPALRQIIDATPSGALAFLVTEFGKPFTANGFGNRFRKWCDEAGLPDCSAHGLRKASAARLAELGCTDHEIMAITGHQTLKEVARYTAAANRKKLAGSGMAKLAQSQTKNECVPLLPTAGESGTILVGKSNKNKAENG